MIYVKDNKATLCKGDCRPAQLYKGETKIAGYTEKTFEGKDSVTLENCYNDKVYDAFVRGKNLLDVSKWYSAWANENGGMSIHSGQLYSLSSSKINVTDIFKENTQYTFSCKYNLTEATTSLTPQIVHTDGTRKYLHIETVGEGTVEITSTAGKTVESFSFTYGTNINTRFECELTDMQIEEGIAATEYEMPLTDATVTVRGKNLLPINDIVFTTYIKIELEVPVEAGTYTISGVYITGQTDKNILVRFMAEGDEQLEAIWLQHTDERQSKTFKINGKMTHIYFYASSGAVSSAGINVSMSEFQLEEGTVATEYEPYIEPQTIMFANGELTTDIPTFKGTTVIEVDADVAVTISGSYKKMEV